MDWMLWLEAITTLATVAAVALAWWAIHLARDAVELQRKATLQDVTVNVRRALADLTTATSEFNAELLPYWKVRSAEHAPVEHPDRAAVIGDAWVQQEIKVHAQAHLMTGLGRTLVSELNAMYSFAPHAWEKAEIKRLEAWILGFTQAAWFAPYSALVSSDELSDSPFSMVDWLLKESYGGLREFAIDSLFNEIPGFPREDAANAASAFFAAAESHVVDAVNSAVDRAAQMVAGDQSLKEFRSKQFLEGALPSAAKGTTSAADDEAGAAPNRQFRFRLRGGNIHEGTLRILMSHIATDYADYTFDERVALARRQVSALHFTRKAQADGPERGPRYLVTSAYEPHTSVPRPEGAPIIWVDPDTEGDFLTSFGTLEPMDVRKTAGKETTPHA
ncbi:hypothetical protein [Nocardioides jishulii]|uniref:Uncharacterized protein n=1 Tax=Nocardioides jishulii TaxID=2575440 RepID=A0A4U2YRU2_9ACTN|nr:hypothetical protein [Nocardioides jishulii]QCX28952.1 hypothetical protein FCL41_16575 [Nocardioides jishulii]TKI64147.1 hypothetical protein FC770_02990 [Nocardioides jishulii]